MAKINNRDVSTFGVGAPLGNPGSATAKGPGTLGTRTLCDILILTFDTTPCLQSLTEISFKTS